MVGELMKQINDLAPGAGNALNVLAQAYLNASKSAGAAVPAMAEFNAALRGVLTTLGPIAIAMLAVEAASRIWDMYKEKAEAAARANEEAAKKIVEASNNARKAVEKLDEAMHPKGKDTVSKDQDELDQQKQQLQNEYSRKTALNQTNREEELKHAKTPEEQEKINQSYDLKDAQTTDWYEHQNAAIEGAMVNKMAGQRQSLEDQGKTLEDQMKVDFQTIKNDEPTTLKQQRDDLERGFAESNQLDDPEAQKKLAKYDDLIKQATEKREAAKKRYEENPQKIQELASQAGQLRDSIDNLSSDQQNDQKNADFHSETTKEVFKARGMTYVSPVSDLTTAPPPGNPPLSTPTETPPAPSDDSGYKKAKSEFDDGKKIADIAENGGQVNDSQKQFLVALEKGLTGKDSTFEEAIRLIESQSQNQGKTEQLLRGAYQRLDVISSRLDSLQSQMGQNHHAANYPQ